MYPLKATLSNFLFYYIYKAVMEILFFLIELLFSRKNLPIKDDGECFVNKMPSEVTSGIFVALITNFNDFITFNIFPY